MAGAPSPLSKKLDMSDILRIIRTNIQTKEVVWTPGTWNQALGSRKVEIRSKFLSSDVSRKLHNTFNGKRSSFYFDSYSHQGIHRPIILTSHEQIDKNVNYSPDYPLIFFPLTKS